MVGETGEGGQKVQISSYRKHKSWVYLFTYKIGKYIVVTMLIIAHLKFAKRVDLKSPNHKKKTTFVTIYDDGY